MGVERALDGVVGRPVRAELGWGDGVVDLLGGGGEVTGGGIDHLAGRIDYRNFRDDIRRQLTMQLLRQRDVIARINISPRELEQYLARQQNAPDRNAEYNVSHILISVPVSATPEQIEARAERAAEVYEKARSGADFVACV